MMIVLILLQALGVTGYAQYDIIVPYPCVYTFYPARLAQITLVTITTKVPATRADWLLTSTKTIKHKILVICV